jgi:Spherulation-specific family 4
VAGLFAAPYIAEATRGIPLQEADGTRLGAVVTKTGSQSAWAPARCELAGDCTLETHCPAVELSGWADLPVSCEVNHTDVVAWSEVSLATAGEAYMEREPFGLLVPAYVIPRPPAWDVLLAAGRKLQTGLITVASRPGNSEYQLYVDAIRALHNSCTTVIGYVDDNHGNMASVFNDIDRWFSTYDVDGIFVDRTSNTDQQHAAALVDHVRGGHADRIVVLNPGTIPLENFVQAVDPALIVIQEQDAAFYEGTDWPPAGWVRDRAGSNDSISPDRLAIIAHGASAESDVEALINIASTYRLGWIYVQDASSPGSDYNHFSTWLPALAGRLQCARAGSPMRYFACKALGGIPCMVRQMARRWT